MAKQKVTIVDADSMSFLIGFNLRGNCNESAIPTMKMKVDDFVHAIMSKTKADKYIGIVQPSHHKTFRDHIYPEYKANRKKVKPKDDDYIGYWRPQINKHLCDEWGFETMAVPLETDDAVSILFYQLRDKYDLTLAYMDKDLNMIGCEENVGHLQYNYREHKFYVHSSFEARYKKYYQLLIGDSTDNIKGCYLTGDKGAKKILAGGFTNEDFEARVKARYEEQYPKYVKKMEKGGDGKILSIEDDIKLQRELITMKYKPCYGYEIPTPVTYKRIEDQFGVIVDEDLEL